MSHYTPQTPLEFTSAGRILRIWHLFLNVVHEIVSFLLLGSSLEAVSTHYLASRGGFPQLRRRHNHEDDWIYKMFFHAYQNARAHSVCAGAWQMPITLRQYWRSWGRCSVVWALLGTQKALGSTWRTETKRKGRWNMKECIRLLSETWSKTEIWVR